MLIICMDCQTQSHVDPKQLEGNRSFRCEKCAGAHSSTSSNTTEKGIALASNDDEKGIMLVTVDMEEVPAPPTVMEKGIALAIDGEKAFALAAVEIEKRIILVTHNDLEFSSHSANESLQHSDTSQPDEILEIPDPSPVLETPALSSAEDVISLTVDEPEPYLSELHPDTPTVESTPLVVDTRTPPLQLRPSEFRQKEDTWKQGDDSGNKIQLFDEPPPPVRPSKLKGVKLMTISTPVMVAISVMFIMFISLADLVFKPQVKAGPNVENISRTTVIAAPEIKQEAAVVPTPAPEIVKPAPIATPEMTPPVVENKVAEVKPEPTQPSETGKGQFTIQVGAHTDESEAKNQASKLSGAGFEPRVVSVDIPKRGRWYRVQSGSFSNRDEANRYGAQIVAKGAAESFVVSGP